MWGRWNYYNKKCRDTFAINKILQYKCNAIQSILQIKEQEKIISVCQDDKKIQYLIWNITSGQVEMVIGDIKVKLYQWYIRAKGQSIVQLNNERVILSSNNSINMINIKNNNYRFEKQINPKGIDEIKESFLFLELKDGNVLCVYSNTGKAYIYNIQSHFYKRIQIDDIKEISQLCFISNDIFITGSYYNCNFKLFKVEYFSK